MKTEIDQLFELTLSTKWKRDSQAMLKDLCYFCYDAETRFHSIRKSFYDVPCECCHLDKENVCQLISLIVRNHNRNVKVCNISDGEYDEIITALNKIRARKAKENETETVFRPSDWVGKAE